MFRIIDNRESFWQWDLDQKLIVEDSSIDEVHFCNGTQDCALVCKTYTEGELTVVNVPNILLQTSLDIRVYAYTGNHTINEKIFKVIKRNKPADYIYTETELFEYETVLAEVREYRKQVEQYNANTVKLLNDTEAALDTLIAIQNNYIGGDSE